MLTIFSFIFQYLNDIVLTSLKRNLQHPQMSKMTVPSLEGVDQWYFWLYKGQFNHVKHKHDFLLPIWKLGVERRICRPS